MCKAIVALALILSGISCAFVQRRELIEVTSFGPTVKVSSLGVYTEDTCYTKREQLNVLDDNRIAAERMALGNTIRMCIAEGAYPNVRDVLE